jgi:hypothetical protein
MNTKLFSLSLGIASVVKFSLELIGEIEDVTATNVV